MAETIHDYAKNSLKHCHFLGLPTELRDMIIAYSVQNDAVTISAFETPDAQWIPVVSHGYDTELLEATLPGQQDSRDCSIKSERQDYPTTLDALKATCKSLRGDVEAYMNASRVLTDVGTRCAPVDLHLTFPHGVCVLMDRFPNILTRVRNIKIASIFDIDKLDYRPWARVSSISVAGARARSEPGLQGYQLSRLVAFLTGRNAAVARRMLRHSNVPMDATHVSKEDSLKRLEVIRGKPRRILQRNAEAPRETMSVYTRLEAGLPELTEPLPFEHFQFRILYPNRDGHDDVYTEVWSSGTPSSLCLHHMFGVLIWLSTARGKKGTSIEIEAIPNADDGRMLTSLWPKKYIESPEGILAAGWMDRDWEDKDWKSFARQTYPVGR